MNKLLQTALIATMLATPALAASVDTVASPKAEVAGKPHGGMHGPRGGFGKAMADLPQEKKDAFRDSMKATHEKNQTLWEKAKTVKAEQATLLKASSFDASAFAKNQATLRDLHGEMEANRDAGFVDAVGKLNQEERSKLATAMEQHREGGHGGHWGKHGGKPGEGPDGAHSDATKPVKAQ